MRLCTCVCIRAPAAIFWISCLRNDHRVLNGDHVAPRVLLRKEKDRERERKRERERERERERPRVAMYYQLNCTAIE